MTTDAQQPGPGRPEDVLSSWGLLLPGASPSPDVTPRADPAGWPATLPTVAATTPALPPATWHAPQPQGLHRTRTTPMLNVYSFDDLGEASHLAARDQGPAGGPDQAATPTAPWQHLRPIKGTLRGAFRGEATEEWLAQEVQREVDDLARCVGAFSVVADSTLAADTRRAALQGQCEQLSRQRGQLASRVSELAVLLPEEDTMFKRLHNELAAVEQECAANHQRLQLEMTAKQAADELALDLRGRVAWLEAQLSALGLPLFQPPLHGTTLTPVPPMAPVVPRFTPSPVLPTPVLPAPPSALPPHVALPVAPITALAAPHPAVAPHTALHIAAPNPCVPLATGLAPRPALAPLCQPRAHVAHPWSSCHEAITPEAVLAAVQFLRSKGELPYRTTHMVWMRVGMALLVVLALATTVLLTLLVSQQMA